MSLLEQLFSNLVFGSEEDRRLADENRKSTRMMLQKAAESGDVDLIKQLQPVAQKYNVDVSPYAASTGKAPVSYIEQLLGITPQAQASQRQDEAFSTAGPAMDLGNSGIKKEAPTAELAGPLQRLFTPEFAVSIVTKQATGVDVTGKLEDANWFDDFLKLPEGMTATEKKETLASKYGYIPVQAAQLKDLSIEERSLISQKAITSLLQDPELDAHVRKTLPNADPDKAKMGFIVAKLAGEGYPLPERYQAFYDRFMGLHDDMIGMKAEEAASTSAAQTSGRIGAEFRGRDLSAQTAAAQTAATKKAGIAAEFEMESEKPISAEDRAKYGIGAKIPTYTALADQGFRFPSEQDRKMYSELSGVRDDIMRMQNLLFGSKGAPKDGVFVGIGNDWVSRKTGQAGLVSDRAQGTQRGQNYELYTDTLASMARRLLTLAGESGGLFTDKDVEQITRSAPDIGGVLSPIDSEAIARQKFERFITGLNKRLSTITEGVVMKPIGGEGKAVPEASELSKPPPIDAFKKHGVNRLTNGTQTWELQNGKPVLVERVK